MHLDFFLKLGKETENQLSRTFAACFSASPIFRQRVLDLLHQTCSVEHNGVTADLWLCATEVRTPKAGGGRLDLRFSAPSQKTKTPVFVIENKVGAKLTLKQLRKYRQHGVKHLIAITKHPADVPERLLKREKIFALRWQDVHRHLSSDLPRTPVDRFLIKSFIQYLEDLEMAYPEQLTAGELKHLRRLVDVAASRKRYKGLDPKDAFATGDHCLQFLEELRRQLVEKIPEFGEFRFWGPMFYVWRDKKENDVRNGFHAFGWEIRGKPWWLVSFSCNFYFPKIQAEPISWGVSLYGRHRPEKDRTLTLAQISRKSDGSLRQELMLRMLIDAAKHWQVSKVIKQSTRRRKRAA